MDSKYISAFPWSKPFMFNTAFRKPSFPHQLNQHPQVLQSCGPSGVASCSGKIQIQTPIEVWEANSGSSKVSIFPDNSVEGGFHSSFFRVVHFGTCSNVVLLMEEMLQQLIGSLSHYLQGFIHPRWCRISSINSSRTILAVDSEMQICF